MIACVDKFTWAQSPSLLLKRRFGPATSSSNFKGLCAEQIMPKGGEFYIIIGFALKNYFLEVNLTVKS